MKSFQPSPQRYLCSLVACIPGALDREPYVQQLAVRLGYGVAVVRREVETIAGTGQAASITAQLREGVGAKSDGPAPLQSKEEPQGWWNLPQGEGEDWLDYAYRTEYRLDLVRDVFAWGLVDEWQDRAAELAHAQEVEGFVAERAAYREIRAKVAQDPLWQEREAVIGGRIGALEEVFLPNDRTVAILYADLIDLMQSRGVDWYDELQERLGAGQDEEGALRSVLRMAGRLA